MARANVDLIVPHIGLTSGGTTGPGDLIEAARAAKPDVIALAHGGSMENPEDVAYVLECYNAQGFVGASSIERLPVETAIVGAIRHSSRSP